MTKQQRSVRRLLRRGIAMATSPWVILIAAALFLICFTRFNKVEDTGNQWLFRLTAPLIQTDGIHNRFVIVRLPDSALTGADKSYRTYEALLTLLAKTSRFGAAGTVIIADTFAMADSPPLKKIVTWAKARIQAGGSESELSDALVSDLNHSEMIVFAGERIKQAMTETGAVQAVLMPQTPRSGKEVPSPCKFRGTPQNIVVKDPWERVYRYLPKAARPVGMPTIHLSPKATVPDWRSAPCNSDTQNPIRHTLWQQNDGYVKDITILLCELMTGTPAVFIPGQGVRFKETIIKTGPYYNVIPHLSTLAGSETAPSVYDYASFLKQDDPTIKERINGAMILVTGDDTAVARSVAQTCTSLLNGSVSYIPGYAWLAEKGLLILILIYLVIVVRKMRYSLSFVMSLLMVMGLLVFQAGAHTIRGIWFPVFIPVLFLVSGHLFMYIILRRRQMVAGLALKASQAYRELGEWHLDAGQYDKAFAALCRCFPDKPIFELLYKTGAAFERKGMYNRAKDVFVYIKNSQPAYRDTAQRVKNLSGLLYGRTIQTTPSGQMETMDGTPGGIHAVLGRYEVEKEIGKGAMGTVYLAYDPKIGRQVAVKTLDLTRTFEGASASFKERFLKEARAAGRLNHPSIVTIYDYGEEQNLAFITMDYIQGKTLSEYTSEKRLLPVNEVYAIVENVAAALHYAHGEGIVHRDIKPGNIMYDPVTKAIKITDFGIARMADTHTTKTGIILGTPSYMAPEQLRGQTVDGRTDVFSLGVTLYQLLTGTLPFSGEDLASLAYCITTEKHMPISTVRPGLPESAVRITDKALCKKPEKRYKTAGSLAKVLKTEIGILASGIQAVKKRG